MRSPFRVRGASLSEWIERAGLALLSGVIVGLFVLTSASTASAWCRTTTTQDFTPTDQQPCDDAGRPLYWSTKCVGFSVQRDASKYFSYLDLATSRTIAQRAFDEWAKVDCPADPVSCGGAFDQGHPSITVKDLGPVSCNCVEYNGKVGNANTIIFRDGPNGWNECDGTPKPDKETTLALTTVTFNTETGEIYDADMEINTSENQITIADPPANVQFDFHSILTHEAGHFLGLAHTQPQNTAATMYARYEQRKVYMRDPSQDDVCGICAAYPPTRSAPCDTTPRRGLALECGGGDPETVTKGGCRCAILGGSASGADVAIGCAFGLLLVGLVRRRARSGSSSRAHG